MQKRNIEQIILLFIVCTVMVAGITWWVDSKNPKTELLLGEDSKNLELDGPLSPEALKDDNPAAVNTMNPKAIFPTVIGI